MLCILKIAIKKLFQKLLGNSERFSLKLHGPLTSWDWHWRGYLLR